MRSPVFLIFQTVIVHFTVSIVSALGSKIQSLFIFYCFVGLHRTKCIFLLLYIVLLTLFTYFNMFIKFCFYTKLSEIRI